MTYEDDFTLPTELLEQAARKAVFSGISWQRCQFHLQQNTSQYVPRQGMKREVAADLRAIFNTPEREQAEA